MPDTPELTSEEGGQRTVNLLKNTLDELSAVERGERTGVIVLTSQGAIEATPDNVSEIRSDMKQFWGLAYPHLFRPSLAVREGLTIDDIEDSQHFRGVGSYRSRGGVLRTIKRAIDSLSDSEVSTILRRYRDSRNLGQIAVGAEALYEY